MNTFHVWTAAPRPQLSLWRDHIPGISAQPQADAAYRGPGADGAHVYEAQLADQEHPPVRAKVHRGESWEENAKALPRTDQYRFLADYWFAEGAARVLTSNPFATSRTRIIIHLLTTRRFKAGHLHLWIPGGGARQITRAAEITDEPTGRRFAFDLTGDERSFFLFKFFNPAGGGREAEWEPEYANKLWCATDGAEIWVHSRANAISTTHPERRPLRIYHLQKNPPSPPELHLWQEDSDYAENFAGVAVGGGWIAYDVMLYTERPYRFCFFTAGSPEFWENPEANRNVFLRGQNEAWTTAGDGRERLIGTNGVWTLEGDHELFGAAPRADRAVSVEVVCAAPGCALEGALVLDVWVNRASALLHRGLQPDAAGVWTFSTYPVVVTSFVFRSATQPEKIERHTLKVPAGSPPLHRFVVLGRAEAVARRPVADLFLDPVAGQFAVERPGAWAHGDAVRFAVHCPSATTVEIVGDWTGWENAPVPMRSTLDGAYWWAEIPKASMLAQGSGSIDGVRYKFRLNQLLLTQDPAADWVEHSDLNAASRLVDHDAFVWQSDGWQRPGWEYLCLYQLHAARFSKRANLSGLPAVTHELTNGYLREINATALLLMPAAEFPGGKGWGYNPSFFYAVESSYGGPAALKALVDACHQRGIAVLLDVVFNHAGTSDNVLWQVARESFFDGDTEWGAMINFDHPQVIHFFEQNLVHFMKAYRIDGFRFDFTRVIRHGGAQVAHVRTPGSGGGWQFMQKLRAAVHRVDARCLFMAENYPNEWDLTWDTSPMDTQWHDDFHDLLVKACKGDDVMGPLASAMQITHGAAGRWHAVTNFAESHDEVGNVNDRITNVAGVGQGFRRNKVAAALAIFARGIPLWFMGGEAGEWRQFDKDAEDDLPLTHYETDDSARRLRAWWRRLVEIRRGNARIEGPAPSTIHFAQERMLAFSRGGGNEFFVVLNFGNWSGRRSLAELNLPWGEYKELLNSTWGDYRVAVENEDEHPNGGWHARLRREYTLNVPDYGVVILERR